MNPWIWLPWLLLLVQTGLAAWAAAAYLLPALELRRALRRLSVDDWDAAAHIVRRGRLDGAVADLAALSERLRRTHRQLGDESLNLQTILGSLAEGVLIVDAAGRVRLANESVRRMFDLSASPLDRTLMEVFRDHTLQETVRAALETEGPQNRQLTLEVSQSGRYVRKHFAVTAAALHPPPGGPAAPARPVQGVIAIFHDISELKALEGVRRDFVANVSHELRTPVSIISGYLETLLDGALDDRETAARFVQVMWKHSQRLTLLIEDLLSLAQLEGQRASGLRFAPVDLRPCLEKVVERLEPLISEKGAAVRLEIPADFPRVEADAHRLDQVFFNLIENALRHGTNGHPPEIRVRAARSRAGDGEETAEITVSDNGPGIPLSDQPHVFERFYRVRKDRAREAAGSGGTGLGLSIVKHVVQAHGGQVLLDSQPGRGATFRLRLPTVQKDEGRRQKAEGRRQKTERPELDAAG